MAITLEAETLDPATVPDQMSPDASRLLSAAAVLGRQFVLDDVGEVLGEQPGTLLRSLHEVMTTRIVVPAGAAFTFRDEPTHHEIYEQVPEPVRLALHRQIGARLLERGGSAVPAAHHLALAARPGDAQLLDVLDRAAQEALAGAPREAAGFARRALDLTEPDDEHRFARGLTAVHALMTSRWLEDAAELARSLLTDEGLPPDAAAELHLRLSSILLMAGDIDNAVIEAEAVVGEPVQDAKCVPPRLEVAGRTRGGRPVEGWESLTDGERRVVALVAEGLTNRQAGERAFLSRHTVDFHLRQAFRKLNITSRVELARLALEHERPTT